MLLKIKLGKLSLDSPIIMVSGTFGYGTELANLINYKHIGAITTKTITFNQWDGNPQPRLLETSSGLINSIGLQNPGLHNFIRKNIPEFKKLKPKIIVSFSGRNEKEIAKLTENLVAQKEIDAIEFNISCPNFQKTENMISQDSSFTYKMVRLVKSKSGKMPLVVKLSPNVTDITEIALASEEGGADILSLINTVKGMGINIKERKIVLGGLSGPAIKPIGLRAVYETYKKIKIPIIGIGGICSGKDALEYLFAGATAVGIGSCLFSNPLIVDEIYGFLKNYLKENNIRKLDKIVGSMNKKNSY